jgi:hypothetical protein
MLVYLVNRMDRFEQLVQHLMKKPKEERLRLREGVKSICICPNCPTYTECAEKAGEVLFCAIGGSFRCIREDLGCICPDCPATTKWGLTGKDYCMKGSEAHQRWRKPFT